MPDGYGNGLPSYVYSNPYRIGSNVDVIKMMARHLRMDHDMPLHTIQKRLGLSRAELKMILGEE